MKGVYIVLINISKTTTARIGALGEMTFEKGKYAYVGSAQNNVEKRVARHMSKHKKIKWHIDYLLDIGNAKATKAFCKKAGKEEECRIARRLSRTEKAIPKFGCSDCDCGSHLFRISQMGSISRLGMDELNAINKHQ